MYRFALAQSVRPEGEVELKRQVLASEEGPRAAAVPSQGGGSSKGELNIYK